MKNIFYNKNLPLEKYFGTNLSYNELKKIHDNYEYFVCKNPSMFYYYNEFNNASVENIDDFFKKVKTSEIVIIKNIMKKFKSYEVSYVETTMKDLLEKYPEVSSELRKIKIFKLLNSDGK